MKHTWRRNVDGTLMGRMLVAWTVLLSGHALAATPEAPVDEPLPFRMTFEDVEGIPASWKVQGAVSLDTAEAFYSKQSLSFQRDEGNLNQPTSLVTPSFPVQEGRWAVKGAHRAALYSPDSSYNGTIMLESIGADGATLGKEEVLLITGKHSWKEFRQTVLVPTGAVAARFRVEMNKTYGAFNVDNLSATFLGVEPESVFSAIRIAPRAYGSFFYPGDPVVFDVSVECSKKWPDEKTQIDVNITDYWGAELTKPVRVELLRDQTGGKAFRYKGVLDLGDRELEPGKYHEVRARVTAAGSDIYREQSSFAILPRPVTKDYRPHEIPFTLNNWDDRMKDTFFMADRMGIRWKLVWSGWEAEPPYEPYAPGIEWIKELDMGALLGMRPVSAVEGQAEGYERWNEIAIREGARNLINKYKDYVPIMIRCGNEPHGVPDWVRKDVAAYKAAYEGAKQADPDVWFIGSSCGTQEEFFKQGFGSSLDAYDFHTYGDWKGIRRIFDEYEELLDSYGHKKPIWCTEIGLNSQGMARLDVARDMVKKFAIFFAEGGGNLAWFDLLYPDPDGKIVGSNGEAFNVFNAKYNLYCPKLTAVTYYNLVNGICIKKFVEEKIYDGEVEAILFRDREKRCLAVVWKEIGRLDAFLPMTGVGEVKLVRIDGSSTMLDARSKGLTLTFSEDPMLLFFDSADMTLSDKLGRPAVALKGELPEIVMGAEATLTFDVTDLPTQALTIATPPGWSAKAAGVEGKTVEFAIAAPRKTDARLGMLTLGMQNRNGELSLPVRVTGTIAVQVLPLPMLEDKAGVRVVIRNNTPTAERVSYAIAIPETIAMANGTFQKSDAWPFKPALLGNAEGEVVVDALSETEVVLKVSNLNPKDIYTVRATAGNSSGETVECERYLSGFAGVARAASPLTMDLAADKEAWAKAHSLSIDEPRQYFAMKRNGGESWDGVADLSAVLRYLWDDKHLYMRVDVTDDTYIHGQKDGKLWAMDGIQLLVDPSRDSSEKGGYYDISLGDGVKGPQAWCHSSADGSVLAGEARDIVVKVTPAGDGTGGRTYVAAIPWSRLAPFTPGVGNNLGMAVIVNEDDGPGRSSFMGWFGCAHSKQLDLVGDLVLLE